MYVPAAANNNGVPWGKKRREKDGAIIYPLNPTNLGPHLTAMLTYRVGLGLVWT
jgi:hypothetical protein